MALQRIKGKNNTKPGIVIAVDILGISKPSSCGNMSKTLLLVASTARHFSKITRFNSCKIFLTKHVNTSVQHKYFKCNKTGVSCFQ